MRHVGQEPATPKPNTFPDPHNPEEATADVPPETLLKEFEEACDGILPDVRAVVGELSQNDWHDLQTLIHDRVADIKFYVGALAKHEQPATSQRQVELPKNVIEFPVLSTLADDPAAQDALAVVDNGGLAGGDTALGIL